MTLRDLYFELHCCCWISKCFCYTYCVYRSIHMFTHIDSNMIEDTYTYIYICPEYTLIRCSNTLEENGIRTIHHQLSSPAQVSWPTTSELHSGSAPEHPTDPRVKNGGIFLRQRVGKIRIKNALGTSGKPKPQHALDFILIWGFPARHGATPKIAAWFISWKSY